MAMAGKRGKGEGSIYKREDGRWCAQVNCGYENGKRKRKYIYGDTRVEVASQMVKVLGDRERGIEPVRDERLTVARFLTDWLETTVKPSVRPRTFDSYQQTVNDHIIPALGRTPLVKLTPPQVQALLNVKATSGLSPRSVAYIRAVLRIALNRAMKWGMVPRNAAALATAPKQKRHEVQPLSVAELKTLMGAISGNRHEALFLMAALCGLRKGELLGLRWQDVDIEEGTLTVRYQAQRINGTKQLVPPKTDASRRTVGIPALVIEALRRHRIAQLEGRLLAGIRWVDLGLVFPSTIGTIADSANVTHAFHDALRRAELPRQRFHDLRHLAASLMLAGNVNPKVMQQVMGHSSFDVTMDLYSHLMPAAKVDAANRIDTLLTGTD
jgi:integrase